MQLKGIKKRKDFQYITGTSLRAVSRAFVLVARPFPAENSQDNGIYFGITASRKLGGAVQRNRVKRRLREAIRQVLLQHGNAGWGYVFIGRQGCADISFEKLITDMQRALGELADKKSGKA